MTADDKSILKSILEQDVYKRQQWIRCQAFGDDFGKMKTDDNQSGNSTIWGVCRQWIRWQGGMNEWQILNTC